MLLLQHGPESRPQLLGQSFELQVHAELWQTREFVQTCPHEPQLLLSLVSLTQAPLQEL